MHSVQHRNYERLPIAGNSDDNTAGWSDLEEDAMPRVAFRETDVVHFDKRRIRGRHGMWFQKYTYLRRRPVCFATVLFITLLILIVFIVAAVKIVSFVSHQSDSPVVKTTCGYVRGEKRDGAYVFKGIPYGLPPVKELRWKPPSPLKTVNGTCWKGVFNATKFGNICFQRSIEKSAVFVGSEDCLYLNVWTPSLKAKLPVMVWIHGGLLQMSSGSWPNYSPYAKFARDTNVVYVSMNYRLHAFGFMALDLLTAQSSLNVSGNYGFMDMIAALEWVQKNIGNFGGDKEQVTIFGQSSGGTAILGLLASPLAQGKFSKAWLLSSSPVFNKSLADAARDNLVFLNSTGCTDIRCLYNMTPETITSAVPWNVYPYWAGADLQNLPTKDLFDGAIAVVDGYVVPEPLKEVFKVGKYVDVPLMIGSTAEEIDWNPQVQDLYKWTWTNYSSYVGTKLSGFSEAINTTAFKLYPVSEKTSPECLFANMASDIRVNCPTDGLTDVIAHGYKSPVYRYVATVKPSRPIHVLEVPYPASCACHIWDLFAFFGTIDKFIPHPSESDLYFQKAVQNNVLSFVKHGKPLNETWKPFPDKTALFGTEVKIVDRYKKAECAFWKKNGFFSYGWIN